MFLDRMLFAACLVLSSSVLSCLVLFCLVLSRLVSSCLVLSLFSLSARLVFSRLGLSLSCSVMSCLLLSFLGLNCFDDTHEQLSCVALSLIWLVSQLVEPENAKMQHVLSWLVLSCPCLVLSYLALSDLFWAWLGLAGFCL